MVAGMAPHDLCRRLERADRLVGVHDEMDRGMDCVLRHAAQPRPHAKVPRAGRRSPHGARWVERLTRHRDRPRYPRRETQHPVRCDCWVSLRSTQPTALVRGETGNPEFHHWNCGTLTNTKLPWETLGASHFRRVRCIDTARQSAARTGVPSVSIPGTDAPMLKRGADCTGAFGQTPTP